MQVTVVMKEFRFILSTHSVRTRTVVFRLVNRGHLAHDFKIAEKKRRVRGSRLASAACCASSSVARAAIPTSAPFPVMPKPA